MGNLVNFRNYPRKDLRINRSYTVLRKIVQYHKNHRLGSSEIVIWEHYASHSNNVIPTRSNSIHTKEFPNFLL